MGVMDYTINGKLDPGGTEIDRRAKAYALAEGCGYGQALRHVLKEANTEHATKVAKAAKIYQQENGGKAPGPFSWRVYQNDAGEVVEATMAGTGENINRLSNIVVGLPKKPDGQIDATLAAQVINSNFTEIAQGAAGDFLSAAASKMLRERNADASDLTTNNPHGSLFSRCLSEAKAKYPEVTSIYNGNQMTEAALQSILWPLFKSPVTQYRSRAEVHRYSADSHISYDNAGREIHRHVFE